MDDEWRKAPHLSASSIGDYLACGFLYRLKRIDRVEPEGRSEALELGSVIHAVLSEFHENRKEGKKLTKKKLLSLFTARWKESATEGIQYSERSNARALLKEGKALLAAYYDGQTDDDFKVIATEEPISFEISGITMLGIIDLIEEDSAGTIIITDFKTTGRAYSANEVHGNMQLSVYEMGLKANGYQDREILLKLDCMIKTKQPRFERYYTTRSAADENRLIKKVVSVWDGIQKGVFIANDGSWKCNYCEYREYCIESLEKKEELL